MNYYRGGLTVVQQRGETAVLGAGPKPFAAQEVAGSSTDEASGSTSTKTAVRIEERLNSSSRGIGRRKLQRKENARLSSNPHVVRPSIKDFSLGHNDRTPSFPLPSELQSTFQKATYGDSQRQSLDGKGRENDQKSDLMGGMTMTYSDAHWFLCNRVGIRPGQVQSNMNPIQQFTKMAEAEIVAWLGQDVFLRPDRKDAVVLIDLPATYTDDIKEVTSDNRLMEIQRTPHNLVWSTSDPFKRLTIHCLARVYGCQSFSKDAPGLPSESASRQTWILKSRAAQRQQQQRLTHASNPLTRHIGDLETPPTTDIGTDVGSELASEITSDVASNLDGNSDWAVSDIGEEDDEMEGEFTVLPGDERDVTAAEIRKASIPPYHIRDDAEDDDAALADVES
ncbi:uncharacterized protein FA14DRAFT_190412 [Meira miltonrushii]|uniref:R3H-associated N-terminal domain-containing protein n=1 Tax=Meira miltonrushii TaxID=1280837 RepID=A0A316V6U6_9BASI|nr:uncharacterized protein FA14DRAFT_190412 [Meira miltonrushii]PWN33246.1 hypothetical protein FA14DRAFT_190412 [Meira miltonrushii]